MYSKIYVFIKVKIINNLGWRGSILHKRVLNWLRKRDSAGVLDQVGATRAKDRQLLQAEFSGLVAVCAVHEL